MTNYPFLLDLPPYPADRYAPLADRIKTLLHTGNDVVFVQGEAILALEAAATSLGRPDLVALNIVTSPYGGYFGDWLRRAGAEVHALVAEAGRPIRVEAVQRALANLPRVDLVAIVHAETSSGILNPLPGIAVLARERDALLVVDAVASVGGHGLDIDALGIDVCVIGPQKGLAGPAGLSMLSISRRAWQAMPAPSAPSSLSLPDLKHNWLDHGRGVVPGMPSALEFWALDAALERIAEETLPAVIERHAKAAAATRAGLVALGAELWIGAPAEASTLATTLLPPPQADAAALVRSGRRHGAILSPGFGAIADKIIRLDHTGQRAAPGAVLANLSGLATALSDLAIPTDPDAALAAAKQIFAGTP